ncbi:calcium/sodium antiporter [Shewanella baltica]|jgi:cation:H+ antiporter|uniref:Na+/Ca+ antiporter, CaCA family n=2 Tax=Shewanella baltica TaxID=62322 RepID=A9KXX1_SHEB9|nr:MULTISPECIES: calcium/sodium antiporter [Shewanella]ABN59883.1 Na+/Ca+ antiporter, CaCA family [Shewanella baltica OS155]ABX47536.1 Na+/Ca+ antiporter, CaCA family [Shewanella baltica OS195]ADT92562.1 Na+/Ca+ antiporter, CaCA family [Shewanella baltica OS678]AEG13117.1 Na+/Ca+ antiporter, CaCA family [Shewanella baltica BA175]AEH12250.1 Na+/Ca+ antiporter, CaCA family [Shewanella baltica OS117]
MLITLSIIGGFIILTLGAEALVRGASAIALRLGITPLIIGLTIVAFGTSAPELAVSVKSALAGNSGIALGNVIGSNIANIGLILAITALIRPIQVQSQVVKRDIPLMILASMLFWGLLLDGELSLIDGVVLLSLLVGYLTFSYISSKNSKNEEEIEAGPNNPLLSGLFILVGISMLVGGGILFVNGAVDLAKTFGVSEVIIGLTIVAIGTSMPELVTSVIAALKGQSDIAIGNVVGSNLFNILGILGVTAIVHPVSSLGFQPFDFMVMLALAIVILPFAWTGLRIGRREGSVLLLTYLGYMGYLINQASAQALV